MNINKHHFSRLASAQPIKEGWIGRIPLNWFNLIKENTKFKNEKNLHLSDKRLSRKMLFTMVGDEKISTLSCCISILSWGGMKTPHGRSLFETDHQWIKVADELRCGNFTRKTAYEKFALLRKENKLPGMGPAYFTKLIFFLLPKGNRGYIMDQWTSASINLIYSKPIVITSIAKRGTNGNALDETVSDKNSSENYDEFCKKVNEIAKKLGVEPEHAEEIMFSIGGRTPGDWRMHVIAERFRKYQELHA